jgi:hypothetical protein
VVILRRYLRPQLRPKPAIPTHISPNNAKLPIMIMPLAPSVLRIRANATPRGASTRKNTPNTHFAR